MLLIHLKKGGRGRGGGREGERLRVGGEGRENKDSETEWERLLERSKVVNIQ